MTLSREQAAEALREIDAAGLRSKQYRSYRGAAPHLFLWALLWLAGYGATALWPRYATDVWGAIVAGWALVALGVLPRLRRKPSDAADERTDKTLTRIVASVGVCALWVVCTALILHPRGRQIGAYVPLVIAVAYIGAGLWGAGPRYAVLGMALGALTLGAYFFIPADFPWLMAVGGFATFGLTGVWLRSA